MYKRQEKKAAADAKAAAEKEAAAAAEASNGAAPASAGDSNGAAGARAWIAAWRSKNAGSRDDIVDVGVWPPPEGETAQSNEEAATV